jgi:hypothetical protein
MDHLDRVEKRVLWGDRVHPEKKAQKEMPVHQG